MLYKKKKNKHKGQEKGRSENIQLQGSYTNTKIVRYYLKVVCKSKRYVFQP